VIPDFSEDEADAKDRLMYHIPIQMLD
jgi:hypothetical protein